MDLNRKERDYLLSEAVPAVVREYVAQIGDDDIGLRIRALEIVTAMAHAERDAIIAVRMVESLRDGELSSADARNIRRVLATAGKAVPGVN